MNRRNFLGPFAATGVAALAAGRSSLAAPRSDLRITRVRILNPAGFKTLAGRVASICSLLA